MRGFIVAIAIVSASCAGGGGDDDDEPVPCESPLECQLGEACLDGVCVFDDRPSEGEGEGEPEPNDDAIIENVCQRLAECQGGDTLSCIQSVDSQIQQMRDINSDVCLLAADSFVLFLSCITGLTCEQMNNDVTAFCPIGNEVSELQNQCFNLGEGEGEGEGDGGGEPPPDP